MLGSFDYMAGGQGLCQASCPPPFGPVSLPLPRSGSHPAILVEPGHGSHPYHVTIKKGPELGHFILYGWGTRIRTLVGGVRVRSPAARRSPI